MNTTYWHEYIEHHPTEHKVGRMGSCIYILDDEGSPISCGYHEIYGSGEDLIGCLGAAKFKINLGHTDFHRDRYDENGEELPFLDERIYEDDDSSYYGNADMTPLWVAAAVVIFVILISGI